jgi:hypothetical protein
MRAIPLSEIALYFNRKLEKSSLNSEDKLLIVN